MLVELAVENYAVIEKVRVRFHPGLNLLTGETGSGKSIVVDALALLLGGRASAETAPFSAAESWRMARRTKWSACCLLHSNSWSVMSPCWCPFASNARTLA